MTAPDSIPDSHGTNQEPNSGSPAGKPSSDGGFVPKSEKGHVLGEKLRVHLVTHSTIGNLEAEVEASAIRCDEALLQLAQTDAEYSRSMPIACWESVAPCSGTS